MSTNDEKQKLSWMEIKCIMVQKSSPEYIHYKISYSDETYSNINIGKKCLKWTSSHQNFLKAKYSSMLPVSLEKKKDLLKLCLDSVIPKEYHAFYENLKTVDKKDNYCSDLDE